MKNFRLSLEIELDAENPLDAAKKLQEWIQSGEKFQYYVQDGDNKIFSVDLNENDDESVLPADDYFPIINN